MGDALGLVPDLPADKDHHILKELRVERMALISERTRILNRSKTRTLAILKRHDEARLKQIKRQLKVVDEMLRKLILQNPKRARAFRILCSIPGMDEVTAMAILVECPEIGTMARKQAASLAGLAPMARQSGQWQGKAFIQGGRTLLRTALYMPALVASRHNPDLKRKYQAMVEAGKPPKVALTTLMRKLIELANVLVREDREWAQKGA